MTAMVKIVCPRCNLGNVDASEHRPGWGVCCAPPPEVAARIAADAERRFDEALKAARNAGGGLPGPPTPAEPRQALQDRPEPPQRAAPSPPGPVTWMVFGTGPVLAHLFIVGNRRSCCGKVRIGPPGSGDRGRVAPRGHRGCRLCARLVGSMGEGVVT